MAGTDFLFNIAKGQIATLVGKVGTGGARLGFLLLINNGTYALQSDADMKDHDTVASLLASNQEAEPDAGSHAAARVTGYRRLYVTTYNITTGAYVNIDDTNERVDADAPDQTWTGPGLGGANNSACGKLITFFDPTGSSADSACTPLTAHNFDVIPDGSDVAALITNFWRSIDG